MAYDPENFRLKSVYLPKTLCSAAEKQAKYEFMNFSAYIRKLVVEDLKKNPKLGNELFMGS